jgi:signal transduction histidine kinase
MLSVIALVVVCIANGLLGIAVLVNNARIRLNRVFAALTFTLAAWSVVSYLEDVPGAAPALPLLAILDYSLAALMVLLFYRFCVLITQTKHPRLQHVVIGLTPVVVILTVIGLVVQPVMHGGNVVLSPRYGYVIFLLQMGLGATSGLVLLTMRFLKSKGVQRRQLAVVSLGIALTISGLVFADVLAPVLFQNSSTAISRLGIYSLLFFTSLSTYAIVRHRLFDVRMLVARSITYLLLLVTLGIAYTAAAFAISRLFFSQATTSWQQTLVYASISLVLAFIFQPLRRAFERLTDRIFYHDRYDSREVLDSISRILVSEMEIDRMLARSLDTLCREVRIQFGQLVIFNHDRVYRVGHFGPLPKRLLVAPELRRFGGGLIMADELSGGERKALLEDHGLQISLGLKTGKEFVGYLLLGDKLSGDRYTKNDIELISLIGKELAVGIANAKSYAEIQDFNTTLQDKVNHATSRLRVANRHLKELDKTKDEFLSMASHQLRTPLTTIKGYLSMMSEGDAGKLTPTQTEFVGYAYDASERMVNLISDLLNVSRLEAGRFLIQPTPLDISAMVADEVRQLQSHATNKHLTLTYIGPKTPLPLVELDENKTRQVIMNFIDNALYYTREGGVTVTLSRHDKVVRLEVTDTGIGVPEVAKKKLFSKFYRADNAQGIRPDGTGLGLYLARRVVVDQGGTIIFKSTEGHGSTFGFELPLTAVKQKVTT